jgi:ABC-type Fe3+ transport system permease subunit
MSTKHAVHFAVCAAVCAFALALALPAFVPMPMLWYRPVEHDWSLTLHPTGIAMDFFGRCLFASAASAIAAAATYVVSRRVRRRDARPETLAVVGIWAIALTVIAMAFFAWRQIHRPTAKAPEPHTVALD